MDVYCLNGIQPPPHRRATETKRKEKKMLDYDDRLQCLWLLNEPFIIPKPDFFTILQLFLDLFPRSFSSEHTPKLVKRFGPFRWQLAFLIVDHEGFTSIYKIVITQLAPQ